VIGVGDLVGVAVGVGVTVCVGVAEPVGVGVADVVGVDVGVGVSGIQISQPFMISGRWMRKLGCHIVGVVVAVRPGVGVAVTMGVAVAVALGVAVGVEQPLRNTLTSPSLDTAIARTVTVVDVVPAVKVAVAMPPTVGTLDGAIVAPDVIKKFTVVPSATGLP
jgi:hypothetical protein